MTDESLTDDQLCDDLWRELGEPWAEGMALVGGCRVIGTYPAWLMDGVLRWPERDNHTYRSTWLRDPMDNPSVLPDWTDWGTLGILLGMAREAWGDGGAFCRPEPWSGDAPTAWTVYTAGENDAWIEGDTEAEALLRAILAGRAR